SDLRIRRNALAFQFGVARIRADHRLFGCDRHVFLVAVADGRGRGTFGRVVGAGDVAGAPDTDRMVLRQFAVQVVGGVYGGGVLRGSPFRRREEADGAGGGIGDAAHPEITDTQTGGVLGRLDGLNQRNHGWEQDQ